MSKAVRAKEIDGFTVVEIMIVMSIIGLLAVLAIPLFAKARMKTQANAFINDLRLAGDAFEQYALENGTFPANEDPGVVPDGMSEYLPRRIFWTERTTIGGHWDWDRAANRGEELHGCYAGLSVYKPDRTTSQMQEIDSRIDDGNLNTGIFRSRTDGYISIIE